MPYEIPTLEALIKRNEEDFERSAPDALRRSDAKVIARALSGAVHELYGFQNWIARQSNPSTCDEAMLLSWADWRLDDGEIQAVAASGTLAVVGSNGSLVEAGQLYRARDGRLYRVVDAVHLVDGEATLKVVAEDVGPLGNLEAGTLTAATPVLGVDPEATIGADGIGGGAQKESLEALRSRVKAAFKNPSKVGSSADFVEWAQEVPGVTRAWALPRWMGPGTFGLAFVRDGAPDIIPTSDQVEAVQQYLEKKRPVTAEVYALAAQARPINFSIRLKPDSPALRTAVEQSLRVLVDDEGGPGKTLLKTHLSSAISNTSGEADHLLIEPSMDLVMTEIEVAIPGVFQWE